MLNPLKAGSMHQGLVEEKHSRTTGPPSFQNAPGTFNLQGMSENGLCDETGGELVTNLAEVGKRTQGLPA